MVNWYDDHATDNPPWIKALAEVRRRATREGWCYQHVQAIIVSIDQYAESATGNRQYFQNPALTRNHRPACLKGRAGRLYLQWTAFVLFASGPSSHSGLI